MCALKMLGSLPVATFLRRDWQRRPLLVRQALAPSAIRIEAARLFALARRDDVESRLVTAFERRWQLAHGPFGARELPPRTRARWTLLVQGVDQLDPVAAAIMARFRFLPDARLDDVMLSFATDHGGVGAHVDSYDVFLLQLAGRRRWRIDRRPSGAKAPLRPNLPLRILSRFEPTDDWILEPGDLLYLPPGIAHEGTALGESITCSVGARAPAWQELVEPWHLALADTTRVAGRYRDPPTMTATRRPARLPAALAAAAFAQLASRRPRPADATRLLLAHLTEPKAQVIFERPARPLAATAFARAVHERGMRPDARTKMLYAGRWFAINGDVIDLAPALRPLLARFADRRSTHGARLSPEAIDQTRIWYLDGWLHLGAD